MTKPCSEAGCSNQSKGRGLCVKHWNAAKREGRLADFQKKPKATITNCPHVDRKHVGHGRCGSCATRYWMSVTPNHNSGNRWLKNNPEKAKHHLRKNHLRKTYGISLEDYDAMRSAQGGKCANTGCDFTAKPESHDLHVDHDHESGKVRGLLCRPCNTALGGVRDDIERLRGLISYLGKD